MPKTDPCTNGRPLSEYEKIRESNIAEQDRAFFEKNGYHLRGGHSQKPCGDFKSNWYQKEEDNKEGGGVAGVINKILHK